MVKNFTMPWMDQKPVAGVYRMSFEGTWFYIGGTKNLARRMHKWKNELCTGIFKNFQVKEAFEKSTEIKLEVVEIVEDSDHLDARETFHITAHWGNPLLLNRSPSAKNNKGLKWTDQQIVDLRERTGQPVAKFDKEGVLIESYGSVKEAIEENNLSRRDILRVFRYNGRSAKGFVYKRLDKENNPIEPPVSTRKPRKKGIKVSEQGRINMKLAQQKRVAEKGAYYPEHTRPMVKLDKSGNIMENYRSKQDAIRAMGIDKGNMKKIIRGSGYYKGFYYKYAK